MASIPYLLNYNGNYPTTTTYGGSGVDIVSLNGNYVSASNEASYIRLKNTGSSNQTILFKVTNNDNHSGTVLVGYNDGKPVLGNSVSAGNTTSHYYILSPNESRYIIIPFKHTIENAECVSSSTSTSYVKNQSVEITAFIGGKCQSLASSACRAIYITDLTFSSNFTGSIGQSCFEDCRISQNTINVGGTTSIEDYAFWGLDANNHAVTITTSSDLSHIGKGSFGLNCNEDTTYTYSVTLNLPGTKRNTYPGYSLSGGTGSMKLGMVVFANCAGNLVSQTTKTYVRYNYSSSLDEDLVGFYYNNGKEYSNSDTNNLTYGKMRVNKTADIAFNL